MLKPAVLLEPVRAHAPTADSAASMTHAASRQTYYTIRFLADRDRVLDAYRAYAYFRWVDDILDQPASTPCERLAFLQRQQTLLNGRARLPDLQPQEQLLLNLLSSAPQPTTGLMAYLHHMMQVMAFDTKRRGRLIMQAELDAYTLHLATAVTEALHYFIGHAAYAPTDSTRYLAVTGAHITHMLRDTLEDTAVGYYNIAREFVEAYAIDPTAVRSAAYRAWVSSRVQLARDCFRAGRAYLARLESRRCQLAGYLYIARFEVVLDAIERDGCCLRDDYPERRSPLRMLNAVLGVNRS